MILLSLWWLCTLTASAVSGGDLSSSTRALDALLQDHAFRAFVRPKTGVAYDGAAPPNMTGIRLSAMRLKSGSLLTRGVSMYKEFEIPKGVVTQPYVQRLALLYHNLANWSIAYYPPLQGYTYLAPILGLVAYDASDLQANGLPHLFIRASAHPISIHFSQLLATPPPYGAPPKCVFFDVNGSLALSDMSSDGVCTTFRQGHFSVVVESESIAAINATTRKPGDDDPSKVWKIVGAVFGGLALLVVLGVVVGWASKYKRSKMMHSMETATEVGEVLFMTAVGTTKAPAAIGTRTHPKLETDYVP